MVVFKCKKVRNIGLGEGLTRVYSAKALLQTPQPSTRKN